MTVLTKYAEISATGTVIHSSAYTSSSTLLDPWPTGDKETIESEQEKAVKIKYYKKRCVELRPESLEESRLNRGRIL
jgi:hypothetical protein